MTPSISDTSTFSCLAFIYEANRRLPFGGNLCSNVISPASHTAWKSALGNVNGEILDRVLLHIGYASISGPLMLIRGGYVACCWREHAVVACEGPFLPRALSLLVWLKVHVCGLHAWRKFGWIFHDEGKSNFTEIFGFLGHVVCFWSKRLIEVIKRKALSFKAPASLGGRDYTGPFLWYARRSIYPQTLLIASLHVYDIQIWRNPKRTLTFQTPSGSCNLVLPFFREGLETFPVTCGEFTRYKG